GRGGRGRRDRRPALPRRRLPALRGPPVRRGRHRRRLRIPRPGRRCAMSNALSQTWYMTQRQLVVFARQPAFAVITLIQPVIWLFLFGNLFRKVVELGGFGTTSYLDYLVPGVVVMSALSSNMWAGMGTLEEIQRGTLNRFLTTPVSRAALMNGNVVNNG